MGALISKSKTQTALESVFKSSTYTHCPSVNIKQTQKVDDITILEGCKADLLFSQEAFLKDDCALSTTIENLSDYVVKNKQDIEKGFVPALVSVDVSDSDESIRQQVEDEVKSMCTNVKSDQTQVFGKVYCQGGTLNLPVLQKFSGRTACVADTLLKRADKWRTENEQTANFFSGIGDFFGKWLNMQILAVVLVFLFFALLLWWLNQGDNLATTAGVVRDVAV